MAKSMKNKERKAAKLLITRAALVRAAFKDGAMSKREIISKTGLSKFELYNLFTADREIYAEYTLRLKTITGTAVDNMYEIIADRKHPKNWEASKYALQNYKSELEEVLTPMGDELAIDFPKGVDGVSRPRIVFSKGKKD